MRANGVSANGELFRVYATWHQQDDEDEDNVQRVDMHLLKIGEILTTESI